MSQFSFIEREEQAKVVFAVLTSLEAILHLKSTCHTIFITVNGQAYFVVECVDNTYGILKVIDEKLQKEIKKAGGNICATNHVELVSNFLMEIMEIKKKASYAEKAEYAMIAYTVILLLEDKMHHHAMKLAFLLQSQPEIGFPRVVDDELN